MEGRDESFFLSAAEGTRFFQMETKRLKMGANFLLKLSDERKEQQQGLWVMWSKIREPLPSVPKGLVRKSLFFWNIVKHYSCIVFLNVQPLFL